MLHLDHGKSVEQCMKAIQAGFTSVMLDGSELPYEENVSLTKEMSGLAHMVDVSVEGEIGTIGVMSNSEEGGVEHVTYTNPEDVVDFVTKTGVDCLAIAIGTAHGIYPKGLCRNSSWNCWRRFRQCPLCHWSSMEEATTRMRRYGKRAGLESVR